MFFLLTRCEGVNYLPFILYMFNPDNMNIIGFSFAWILQCLWMLCNTILSFGSDLHGVLSGSGAAQSMQVLPGRFCRCSERECHAQVTDNVSCISVLYLLYFYLILIPDRFCSQRCDWGRHSAPPRHSDRPVGYASTAAHLPPQHHPLHRGDLNPAVNDRNNRSSYSRTGCITKQVRAATVFFLFLSLFPISLISPSYVLLGVCGNTSVASACVCFSWFSQCLWLTRSPSSSTWISGSSY